MPTTTEVIEASGSHEFSVDEQPTGAQKGTETEHDAGSRRNDSAFEVSVRLWHSILASSPPAILMFPRWT